MEYMRRKHTIIKQYGHAKIYSARQKYQKDDIENPPLLDIYSCREILHPDATNRRALELATLQ